MIRRILSFLRSRIEPIEPDLSPEAEAESLDRYCDDDLTCRTPDELHALECRLSQEYAQLVQEQSDRIWRNVRYEIDISACVDKAIAEGGELGTILNRDDVHEFDLDDDDWKGPY